MHACGLNIPFQRSDIYRKELYQPLNRSYFLNSDMVNETVIPLAAVGIQYFGGPVVTILASKTSRKLLEVFNVPQGTHCGQMIEFALG